LGSSPRPSYRVLGLEEIEAIAIPGALNWRPVRGVLGVRAFGIASFHAERAGDELIEPHIDSRDGRGHEELYFVVRGRARFALDGETFDAPAGTLVFVQPDVHRHGVAVEAGTEVLALGGDPVFRPSGSEFIWRVRALLPDRLGEAQAVVDEGPPDSPGVMYAQALVHHAARRVEEARAALARATALEPRLVDEAAADDLG
jgi:hypothetical protein